MKKNYTYKEIETIYDFLHRGPNILLQKMSVLFAYVTDVCNSSKNEELKNMSELVIGDAFFDAIVFMCGFEMKQEYNKGLKDVKMRLIKKIASYVMICLYNEFSNTTNLNVEFIEKKQSEDFTDLALKVGNEILDVFEITKKTVEEDFVFDDVGGLELCFENFAKKIEEFERKVKLCMTSKSYRCITDIEKNLYLKKFKDDKKIQENIIEDFTIINNCKESKEFVLVAKEYLKRILEAANNKMNIAGNKFSSTYSKDDEVGLYEIKLCIDNKIYTKNFRDEKFSTVITNSLEGFGKEYKLIEDIIFEMENAKNIKIHLDYEILGNIKDYSIKYFLKYLDNTLENNLVYKVNNFSVDLECGDVYCYELFEDGLFNNFVKKEWFVTNTSNEEYSTTDWKIENAIFKPVDSNVTISKQIDNQIITCLKSMMGVHSLNKIENIVKKLFLILNNNNLELEYFILQLVSESTYSQIEYSYDFETESVIYNIRHASDKYYSADNGRKEIKENRIFKSQINAINEDVKRNDPCPCGSGKKYKKCCGK